MRGLWCSFYAEPLSAAERQTERQCPVKYGIFTGQEDFAVGVDRLFDGR
jgi:hypothetical protein